LRRALARSCSVAAVLRTLARRTTMSKPKSSKVSKKKQQKKLVVPVTSDVQRDPSLDVLSAELDRGKKCEKELDLVYYELVGISAYAAPEVRYVYAEERLSRLKERSVELDKAEEQVEKLEAENARLRKEVETLRNPKAELAPAGPLRDLQKLTDLARAGKINAFAYVDDQGGYGYSGSNPAFLTILGTLPFLRDMIVETVKEQVKDA
jgi:myosin heavy subunit